MKALSVPAWLDQLAFLVAKTQAGVPENARIESKAQRGVPNVSCKLPADGVEEAETVFISISNECHVDSRFDGYIKVYKRPLPGVHTWSDIYPFVGDDCEDAARYAVTVAAATPGRELCVAAQLIGSQALKLVQRTTRPCQVRLAGDFGVGRYLKA
jgi:hypothetical protein